MNHFRLLTTLMTLLTFGTALAHAADSKSIIALEYATGTIEQSYGSAGTDDNRDCSMVGLKLGAKTDVKRLFLSFRKHTTDNPLKESDGKSFSIEYDALASENKVAIFAGFILGYAQDTFYGQDAIKRSHNDFLYGFNLGLTFDLDFMGFDVGMRYTYPLNGSNDDVSTQSYDIGGTATSFVALNYLY